MRVEPAQRMRFERQVEMLRAIDDADELDVEETRSVLAEDENGEPPELELHRRGRALGMARPRR